MTEPAANGLGDAQSLQQAADRSVLLLTNDASKDQDKDKKANKD